jgi:hypothetical protein
VESNRTSQITTFLTTVAGIVASTGIMFQSVFPGVLHPRVSQAMNAIGVLALGCLAKGTNLKETTQGLLEISLALSGNKPKSNEPLDLHKATETLSAVEILAKIQELRNSINQINSGKDPEGK